MPTGPTRAFSLRVRTGQQNTPPDPDDSPEPAAEQRGARRAVTLFPLLVLLAGALGLLSPGSFTGGAEAVPYLLGVVMFCMGLTMTVPDFRSVVRRPWAVALGLAAQYLVMPGLGWLVAQGLGLSPQLAAGLILVGCSPGGTASNVVTYLARGDVALSVSVTSVSTFVAPLLTPPLTLFLAGEFLPVDTGSMVGDIVKTVLLPVLGGLLVRLLAGARRRTGAARAALAVHGDHRGHRHHRGGGQRGHHQVGGGAGLPGGGAAQRPGAGARLRGRAAVPAR